MIGSSIPGYSPNRSVTVIMDVMERYVHMYMMERYHPIEVCAEPACRTGYGRALYVPALFIWERHILSE